MYNYSHQFYFLYSSLLVITSQTLILSHNFARNLTFDSAMVSHVFSLWALYMQNLATAGKMSDNETNCFCLIHVRLAFRKKIEKMKHANYVFHKNTYTAKPIETNSENHNQELFLFLFQVADFSAMGNVVLVSQRQVLLDGSSPCPPHHRAESDFFADPPIFKSSSGVGEKAGANSLSKIKKTGFTSNSSGSE